MMPLSDRYDRQITLPEIGMDGQAKLANFACPSMPISGRVIWRS